MKLLFALFLTCPFISLAQKSLPRFENDTVYTSSGFKIYQGQTLKFGRGTVYDNTFRFIRLTSGRHEAAVLTNNQCVVKKLSKYKVTNLGNAYIFVDAQLTYKDGSVGGVNFNLAFDNAIEGPGGLPSELIVPEEFRPKPKLTTSEEIERFYKLYQDGILTKEEFETQKKKLLNQ